MLQPLPLTLQSQHVLPQALQFVTSPALDARERPVKPSVPLLSALHPREPAFEVSKVCQFRVNGIGITLMYN